MTMAHYLDHNATSPLRASAGPRCRPRSTTAATRRRCTDRDAPRAPASIEAREHVAKLAGAQPSSVIFTSGGSEANALALKGAVAGALAAEDRITRLFVSAIEHESVRATAAALAEPIPGLKVSTIPVTSDGVIDLAAFRLQLMQGKGRALVSVMAANNETGVIQHIAAVKHVLVTDGSEGALLHVDAVQAAGRLPISFRSGGLHDALRAQARRTARRRRADRQGRRAACATDHGGGGQESGRRAGTENVAAIAGFGAAAQDAADLSDVQHLASLRDRFEAELLRLAPDAVIFGRRAARLPNTSNFAIPGFRPRPR